MPDGSGCRCSILTRFHHSTRDWPAMEIFLGHPYNGGKFWADGRLRPVVELAGQSCSPSLWLPDRPPELLGEGG
jgi:hypothetical protein